VKRFEDDFSKTRAKALFAGLKTVSGAVTQLAVKTFKAQIMNRQHVWIATALIDLPIRHSVLILVSG
jgi:hypothetical protein